MEVNLTSHDSGHASGRAAAVSGARQSLSRAGLTLKLTFLNFVVLHATHQVTLELGDGTALLVCGELAGFLWGEILPSVLDIV